MVRALTGLFLGVLLTLPTSASAGLFGNAAKPFIAPDRMFAVSLPSGWTVKQGDNPNEVQFYPPGDGNPVMHVRRLDVPAGADPIQLALRALDTRLTKMPGFRLGSKKRVTVGGHRAASVTGTYAFQGNIQFPRAIEEVFVVVGSEAFVLHFDCFEGNASKFAAALNRFYQSFTPRPGTESTPKAEKAFPEVETMPF